MADEKTDGAGENPIDPVWAAELCCWFVVLLAPFLTWVNGPSVSTDQFVVRCIVFWGALTTAIVLRVTQIVRRRRDKWQPAPAADNDPQEPSTSS